MRIFGREFFKKKPEWNVIEVPAPVLAEQVEDDEAIRTLALHPGFRSLVRRLALQKAVIQTKLLKVHHKDLREVDNLQAGIFWLEYLDTEVTKMVGRKPEKVTREILPDMDFEFRKVLAQIESI